MHLKGKQIGFALPEGHFSMPDILTEVKKLVSAGADVYPLFLATSEQPEIDSQFTEAKKILEQVTGREMLTTTLADEAGETSGEDINFDIMVIAPCPGNFLVRLVNARTTSAPLSKTVRHLQEGNPVVLAVITNGDSESLLQNVEQILSIKSFFLVPFGPVDQGGKQIYLARLDLLAETVTYAVQDRQLEPVYLEPCWLPH
ncbi:HFCD family protein [Dethiobacter alkaliphilus]|uniref:Flavoprotein n=1 Tax=Dethiobacter alkaliphilus AHT 1 TaxID=555088 RepID=C0GGI2_DETAL|nr:flavoprotein [Dethiobacter alkaliphilus]EEG77423.1 flavoprotein [Dethiobacter alkaliphilus AHT 1]